MPALSSLQPAKVATPAVTVIGLVVQPERVPPAGLVPIVSVIWVVLSVVTMLPPASSTLTTGWAAKALPPAVLAGVVVKIVWVAGPTVMLKALEKPLLRPEPLLVVRV